MKEIDLKELFCELKKNKRRLIKWSLVSFVIGLIFAFSIPNQYKSTLIFAPEGKSQKMNGSAGMLVSMLGLENTAEVEGISAKIYPEILRSTPFLMEFSDIEINIPGNGDMTLMNYLNNEQKSAWWSYIFAFPSMVKYWFSDSSSDEQQKREDKYLLNNSQIQFTKKLSSCISVMPTENLITINVMMQNPRVAAVIADSVMNIMSEYMKEYRTSRARKDLNLAQKLYDQAYEKYLKTQNYYSQLVDKNRNLISAVASVKIDNAKAEYDMALSVFQQVAVQLESAKFRLAEQIPIATVIQPAYESTYADYPNKKVIVIIATFLGVLFAASKVIFGLIYKKAE